MAHKHNVKNWTCDDVKKWLNAVKLGQYESLFCNQHIIDGEALLELTERDLRQPPIQMHVLGDIKRFGIALRRLQLTNRNGVTRSLDDTRADGETICRYPSEPESGDSDQSTNGVPRQQASRNVVKSNGHMDYYTSISRRIDSPDTSVYDDQRCDSLPPEPWKTLLSFVYVFSVFLITSLVMVIVHDRVPDMDKYPPLPDLFLDNMPYVPWAFECCEVIAIVLSATWIIILIFHKHRFILLRRVFSLTGTVFMLRCISMLITSMSVPGVHISCREGKTDSGLWSTLERSLIIWKGFGMSLQGVRSCGDYMFSGHTVIITTLNFFITEYTPQINMFYLHTFSWVLNLFGIFFILAAHEHYSIDVFVAFYITSRLFLYYHTLANNRGFIEKRTKIWFPLFSFFESKCIGAVPNEFEWPLPWPRSFKSYFENVENPKER